MLGFIDRIGNTTSALFEPVPLEQARRRWEVPCLLLLLVIAAIVRFYGVGSFGLHRPDEDTTVLPAVHILQDGKPLFPSGMLYARAVVQSYLIAASDKIFGPTEWALRLPSVLCGILLVALTFFVGRRFLLPAWNLVLVAVVALLPGFIADSQEARMYSFLCASLAAYSIYVFRWERTNRISALLAAYLSMVVAIQFQEIAVFASLLLLFPGLVHGDRNKLISGAVALLAVGISYLVISHINSSFHPEIAKGYAATIPELGTAPDSPAIRFRPLLPALAAIAGLGLSWLFARGALNRRIAWIIGGFVFVGLMLQAVLFYHLAIWCYVIALVLGRRNGAARAAAIVVLLAVSAALAAAHISILHGEGVTSLRKAVGVMVGRPSIWPYLRVADYSIAGLVLIVLGLIGALINLSARRRIPDIWLFFALAFAVPLFALGVFGWYVPPRYTEFAVLPMLICALAPWQRTLKGSTAGALLVAVLAGLVIVNPRAVAGAVNSGKSFPDHRGAAQFIREVHPGPRDIVVAEEVLMQTYYLGHVDYWLYRAGVAAKFAVRVGDKVVDEYTATPIIGTGAELQALLDRPDRGAIYIIGSGEGQEDGRLYLRGPEIYALLKSPAFKVVYTSPDGITQVLKADAPAAAAQ